jgi:hypothetical protein
MSDVTSVTALKNAWNGVVAASAQVAAMGPAVQGLDDQMDARALDLETYHRATLAQSIAVMALRGLVEQLQRAAAGSPR